MTGKSLVDTIWADALPHLMAADLSRDRAAGIIQNWMKEYDPEQVRYAVTRSIHAEAQWPPAFITGVLNKLRDEAPRPVNELSNERLMNKLGFWSKFCETRTTPGHRHDVLRELRAEAEQRKLL